jgi:hypothetical protein
MCCAASRLLADCVVTRARRLSKKVSGDVCCRLNSFAVSVQPSIITKGRKFWSSRLCAQRWAANVNLSHTPIDCQAALRASNSAGTKDAPSCPLACRRVGTAASWQPDGFLLCPALPCTRGNCSCRPKQSPFRLGAAPLASNTTMTASANGCRELVSQKHLHARLECLLSS